MLRVTLFFLKQDPNSYILNIMVEEMDDILKKSYLYNDSQTNTFYQQKLGSVYSIYAFSGSNGGNGASIRSHLKNISDLKIRLFYNDKEYTIYLSNYEITLPNFTHKVIEEILL